VYFFTAPNLLAKNFRRQNKFKNYIRLIYFYCADLVFGTTLAVENNRDESMQKDEITVTILFFIRRKESSV